MRINRKHPIKTFGVKGFLLTTLYVLIDFAFIMIFITQQEYTALVLIVPVTLVIIISIYTFIREYNSYLKEIPGILIENDILTYSKTNGKTVKIPMFQMKEIKIVDLVQKKPVFMLIELKEKSKTKVLGEMIKIKYYPGVVPKQITIFDNYKTSIKDIYQLLLQEAKIDGKE